jgi:hypothetical protein
MTKVLAVTAIAIMIASTGAATAKTRHHHYRHAPPSAQMNTPGQPGAYGSPGTLTPGYSSTARHKPTDTNGGGGQ